MSPSGGAPAKKNSGFEGPKRAFSRLPQPTSFSGNPGKLSLPKAAKQICEILHRLLVQSASCSRLLFLSLLPCGCCCCPRAGSTHPMPSDRTTCRQLLERVCMMPSPHCHDALGVFARRVLCGSTAMRRGAAPYADGCERFFGRSHLISLLLFCGSEAELAVDMARFCVHHDGAKSSVWFGRPSLSLPTPPF